MILNRVIEMKQNQRYFQVEVKKGQSILDAALEQNVFLDYKCKKGTCGKCKVELVNGSTYLQPANGLEEKKLKHLIQKGFRLACQSIVEEMISYYVSVYLWKEKNMTIITKQIFAHFYSS